MSWHGAADRISYACDLAGRLPVTFAALGAGLIDPVHAKISSEQTGYLSAADAAKADPLLAAAAQHKTYAELRAAAAKLVLKPDPESAERRKAARRKTDAHVRPFREESGNAGMTARELPPDEVLASWQHVEQRARELRAAGVPGTLRELRIRAYLDLLQERDSRLTAGPVPGQHQDQHQDQGPADGPDPQPQPDTRARDYLRTLRVQLTPIARDSCDHKHAETGYQPSRKLQHLIRTRSTRCTAPGCGRPAARCDLDHTLAWDKGGLTCECGIAPLCRHHHRCKQARGWQLTQPEPGVLKWKTPHGRTFTTTPTEYPL